MDGQAVRKEGGKIARHDFTKKDKCVQQQQEKYDKGLEDKQGKRERLCRVAQEVVKYS